MKPVLPLFVFIDACGWEIIRDDPFLGTIAPHRRRLESVFGYSSACVPSIVSGRWPAEHRNWCYFVYDPEHSPFKFLRPLRWLPKALTSRRIFRRWLSKWVKARMKFRGYFDLYNIPFDSISAYDFTEKKSPLQPGGLNRGPNIFDFLEEKNIPYHVSDPAQSEARNRDDLMAAVADERIDFAFVYWPDLDGLLHRVGSLSAEVPLKLRVYEKWLGHLLRIAREHYADVRLYVFSDHGMADCSECIDLKQRVQSLPLQPMEDYTVVYDSTMARFWFFNERARRIITDALRNVSQGRILPDEELHCLHCDFPDRYFGELIFLLKEGVLIVPSDMGERPLHAMHGYHPGERNSYAALLTDRPDVPQDIQAIPDIYKLMTRDAMLAKTANQQAPDPPTQPVSQAAGEGDGGSKPPAARVHSHSHERRLRQRLTWLTRIRRLSGYIGTRRAASICRRFLRGGQDRQSGLKLLAPYHDGLFIQIDTHNDLERRLLHLGSHEPEVAGFLSRSLKPGMIALDVGACIGCHTLIMGAAVGRAGRVFAFEPSPEIGERLRANIRLNRLTSVEVIPCCVSDRPGPETLFAPLWGEYNQGVASMHRHNLGGRCQEISATKITLDDFVRVRCLSRIDLIKIDVEGHEFQVLLGARESLRELKPLLILEFSERQWANAGVDLGGVEEYLAEAGYTLFVMRENLLANIEHGLCEECRLLAVPQHEARPDRRPQVASANGMIAAFVTI